MVGTGFAHLRHRDNTRLAKRTGIGRALLRSPDDG
jgi:hypothetical protein